jgi:ABC-type antimicrobial peptide transport system permease subunit
MQSDKPEDHFIGGATRKEMLLCGFVGGLVGAVLVIGYFYLLAVLGQNPLGRYAYAFVGLSAVGYIGAMYYYRYKLNGGLLSGIKALLIGTIVNITITLAVSFFIKAWFDFTDFGQELTLRYLDDMTTLMESSREYGEANFGKEKFDQTLEAIKNTTTSQMALDFAIKIFVTGIFSTFLYMLFLRNRDMDKKTLSNNR